MAVMLYLLGLSYGAVALALTAFGYPWSKTSVYDAVQAAAARVPGIRRDGVFKGGHAPVLASDVPVSAVEGNGSRWG